jgi:Xaa-Pro aminopeptidase
MTFQATRFVSRLISALFLLSAAVSLASAQQRREREPNSAYSYRRSLLSSQNTDGPIILWGFTGREEISQTYIFAQEDNFYYLTGHNEEGAGLIILPPKKNPNPAEGPREILFLPAKNPGKEKWNGVRLSPTDPGIEATTGFPTVKPFSEMREAVENLAKFYSTFYTVLPYHQENGGYPHEKAVADWLALIAPQAKLKDVRVQIEALRQIKSSGEIAFLQKAIDLSLDAHLAAMKMMRPGLFEYQVAAKMVEVHAMGGSESEGYAPIVGAGPNSTALHYDKLDRKIQEGDIVVLDVGAQFSGYSADITRTLPANGKFTPRQREIYDIVLAAQNAAIAAIKPGANFCRDDKQSLFNIAYNYINTHGKDLHGKPLGQYFIHGLGHGIGLDVHDPTENCKPLQPGMVVTIEPGIYIPEENLGVRIEDDFLITESGAKFLSEKLPRDPDAIEKIMAEPRERSANLNSDSDEIKNLVAKYTHSIDSCDTNLAAQVWLDSPTATFIHPLGHEHGFTQIKENIYEKLFGQAFSERKLSAHDISVDLSGDSAVAEFYWDFTGKFRHNGSQITTHGRETQIYFKRDGAWRLAHVHYSGMPAAIQREGF